LDRGRDVLPTFQITPQNAPHILSICQRLDGIPLALELAAARLNMLSTEQLSARLDNTFRLLVGGARTAVPRQQTLRATIDWSYQLINPSEQLLLRRLSVFVGSFYLEGVEATCTDQALEAVEILDILTSLVNKSMLIADRIQGVKPSYHLLETVRQYAREKLFDAGESEALRNRHLAYYVDFAEQAAHHIHDAGRLEWTAYLKTEHANIREALEWAFTDQTLTLLGLRIATAITDRFWFTLGYYREGEYWLARGLQIAGDKVPPPLLASVYYSLGRLFALHDKTNTLHFLNLCIDLSRELAPVSNRELAMALALSASAYDPETALQRSTEGVKIARTLASTDVWPLAEALYFQSDVLFLVGLSDQAFAAAQECVQLAEMGDRWMAGGYWLSGVIQTQKDQFELARQNLKKGLERNIEVDDRMGIWYSLLYLSWHYLRSGKLHQVQVYCRDLLKLNDLFKTLYHFYDLGLAGLLLARYQKDVSHTQVPEEWLDAVHLLAAFEKWGESFFTLGYELIKKDHLDALSFLRQNIDPVVFEAAWEEGRQLAEPLDEAINYALSLVEKYTFQDCPA
jgi:non-specific serine/threonine protein kinase